MFFSRKNIVISVNMKFIIFFKKVEFFYKILVISKMKFICFFKNYKKFKKLSYLCKNEIYSLQSFKKYVFFL